MVIQDEITFENSTSAAAASLSVTVDVGNLFSFDPRPVDTNQLRKSKEEYLKSLCEESTQLIVNKVFELPRERVEDVLVAKMPRRTTILPREKSLPKKEASTKWEKYAKLKGIQKKKKSRMVYDEVHKEYRPRYGYGRKEDSTKDWLIEIKKNEDPNQDFFSKRKEEKNERVAKNELQRLRNIARGSKQTNQIPGVGLTPNLNPKLPEKNDLKKALHIAKRSDASLSKFSDKIKDEDKTTKGLGKKRKFENSFGDMKVEKERQLKVFDKIRSNKDKSSKDQLYLEKAVNKHLEEGRQADAENRKKAKPKRRSMAGIRPRKTTLKKKPRKN